MKRSADAASQDSSSVVYSGSTVCGVVACGRPAYYRVGSALRCGGHSSADRRAKLPADPDGPAKRRAALAAHEAALLPAGDPVPAAVPGALRCYRLLMMRQVPLTPGWLTVLPNRRAARRSDGRGMPGLSPFNLGPVDFHNQPGLGPAQNIENYHQFNKVWESELARPLTTAERAAYVAGRADLAALPPPAPVFYETQRAGYADPEGHRHKESKSLVRGQSNRNAPIYSVHRTAGGRERRYTYVQSRYFYCSAYERLAPRTVEFRQLAAWLDAGVNIQLAGYDAHPLLSAAGADATVDADTLYAYYCADEHPFGHERVLYALLALRHAPPAALPWNRYRREHPALYDE